MRLIVLIHLIGVCVLTVYLQFFWHGHGIHILEHEEQRICKRFSGCTLLSSHKENITMIDICTNAKDITCTGDSRCCRDCKYLQLIRGVDDDDE